MICELRPSVVKCMIATLCMALSFSVPSFAENSGKQDIKHAQLNHDPAVRAILKLSHHALIPLQRFPATDNLVGIMLRPKDPKASPQPMLLLADQEGR